jgi:hypothetical protein
MRARGALASLGALIVLGAAPARAPAELPGWWPRTLQLGLADGPGGAAGLRAQTHLGFRYQYLAGGVDTGKGWETWDPGGSFADGYVRESARAGMIPVFSYYMVNQSAPGLGGNAEDRHDLAVLRDVSTMRLMYEDFRALMQRIDAAGSPAVVQVEPDLWGYIQQASHGDDAATVPAAVASTGIGDLQGLPNTAAGFAQAVLRLAHRYAPRALLGYHLSTWGTSVDPFLAKPPPAQLSDLAARSARFYRSLAAAFPVSFAEFSDRDADFNKLIRGIPNSAWQATDFARQRAYLAEFNRLTGLPLVLWQIPMGNRIMRAENDTWGHFESDQVPWLLGRQGRRHMSDYVRAGVAALLFGGGADGTTCACDADHDGIKNPPPIDGNTHRSLSADDDGGYFKQRARAYFRAGALSLAP